VTGPSNERAPAWRRAVAAAIGTALLVTTAATGAAADTTAATSSRTASVPGEDWAPVPREEVADRCGLDPDLLLQADLLLAGNPYTVVRYGELCWQGGHPLGHEQPLPVFSVTKTFGAVLVGAVAARSSLDDTTRLTDWLEEDELGDVNPEATIAHVLAMTATDPDLSAGNRDPWTYDTFGDREIDLLVTVADRVIAAESEGFEGADDSVEFAQTAIFDRLGMAASSWPGGSIGAGMVSTPADLARLGLLLLRRGIWDGAVVLDEAFAYRMTHPAFEDSNTGYGYLTYLNAENGRYSTGTADDVCAPYTTWPAYPHAPFFELDGPHGGTPFEVPAPHDIGLVWAAGAGGQRIAVHRGLDLVITVRDSSLSTDVTDPGMFEGHKSVFAAIRPALVAHDAVFAGDEEAFCEAYRRSAHAPDLLDPWSPAATAGTAPASAVGEGAADATATDEGAEDAARERSSTDPSATPSAGPVLPATGSGPWPTLAALALLGAAAASARRTTAKVHGADPTGYRTVPSNDA
jgi:hypothetical protein